MDRLQLKTDAKAAMQQTSPHPALVTLVYVVVIFAVEMIVSLVSGFSSLFSMLAYDSSAAAAMAAGMAVPTVLLSLAVSMVMSVLKLGYTGYCLRVINRHPAGIGDLFGYARYFLKAWGLTLVMGFFVFLWSLLLYIPGIIAMYRYSMAYYILAEDPEKGIMDCIRESKAMMIGHKLDKFVLDLSFILWILLVCVTCGIAALYVSPYMGITEAAFYNSLKYGYGSYQPGYGAGGYQQGCQPNFQQGGYQQAYDPNAPQGGYQQAYDPNYRQGSYQQAYDPNYQQAYGANASQNTYQQYDSGSAQDPYQQSGPGTAGNTYQPNYDAGQGDSFRPNNGGGI